MQYHYSSDNAFSADLKRTAHRVRQVVDARKGVEGKKSRQRRLVTLLSADGKELRVQPGIDARKRHELCQIISVRER